MGKVHDANPIAVESINAVSSSLLVVCDPLEEHREGKPQYRVKESTFLLVRSSAVAGNARTKCDIDCWAWRRSFQGKARRG